MKEIKSLNDLNDDNLQQLSASQVTDFIEEELKKSSEKFAEEKERLKLSFKLPRRSMTLSKVNIQN